MKRIVILIDGTWNDEGHGNDTNIAKLDPDYAGAGAPLIAAKSTDGVAQMAFYHKGVGAEPDLLKHLLGGAIGLGLKQIIDACEELRAGRRDLHHGIFPRRLCGTRARRTCRRIGNSASAEPARIRRRVESLSHRSGGSSRCENRQFRRQAGHRQL
jgi:hypothetical protein